MSQLESYNPGIHIVATFKTTTGKLADAQCCKQFFDELIETLQLHKVGEVYHSFDNDSFTAVVCLTESHVSIHTWPEYQLATFDVFLSNFREDNNEKAREFYARTLAYFEATEINKHEINR